MRHSTGVGNREDMVAFVRAKLLECSYREMEWMGWDQRETLSRNLHGMVSDKHTQSQKKRKSTWRRVGMGNRNFKHEFWLQVSCGCCLQALFLLLALWISRVFILSYLIEFLNVSTTGLFWLFTICHMIQGDLTVPIYLSMVCLLNKESSFYTWLIWH